MGYYKDELVKYIKMNNYDDNYDMSNLKYLTNKFANLYKIRCIKFVDEVSNDVRMYFITFRFQSSNEETYTVMLSEMKPNEHEKVLREINFLDTKLREIYAKEIIRLSQQVLLENPKFKYFYMAMGSYYFVTNKNDDIDLDDEDEFKGNTQEILNDFIIEYELENRCSGSIYRKKVDFS